MPERPLPTGTVTFLFTDIEGSTRLVQDLGPAAYAELLERHNAILREAFAEHGGIERGTQGDSFLELFTEAPAAVAAAVEAQRALHAATWADGAEVRVRMGLHSGLGTLGGDDYVGVDVHRAARIAAAAHGGQVLVSDATRSLVEGHLPNGVELLPLGEHELRDVARPEPIYQVLGEGLRAEFPPLTSAGGSSRGNLPPRLTSFIGRDVELDELARLLDSNRLLTLVGPGGTGKTSLAVELLRREADRFRDGTWFVALETVHDAELVAGVLAATFGLVSGGISTTVEERLGRFLAARSLAVVVDNVEQVLEAAPLLPRLLRVSPGLSIVATSRAPLRVAGEQEFPVPPLAVPPRGQSIDAARANDAIRLFEDRAARVRPGYQLTAEDVDAVAEICRRLDGLPLGIEIAASRMALLPARDIADRLGRRLDLPGTGSRDAPERQRTLQAAIAWSYDLLREPERRLLERLSAFAGSFAVSEAEAVAGPAEELGIDVMDGVSTLVDHSLVQPAPSALGARFRLLTTVRMFAAERLAEGGAGADLRRRHATTYLAVAEAIAPHLPGPNQVPRLDRLAEEQDNLRAAVDWAITTGEVDLAQRLAAAQWRFWQGRGHIDEGWATVQRILAMRGADAPTPGRVALLDAAGGVAWWRGDVANADRFYQEQVDIARRLGEPRALANALFNLSHSRVVGHDPASSEAVRAEAIRVFEGIGDARGAARVEWLAANVLTARDPAAATDLIEGLLRRYVELDDIFYVAMANGTLSWALLGSGRYDEALEPAYQSYRLASAAHDIGAVTIGIREVEIVLQLLGHPRPATILEGAFEAFSSRYGISTPPAFSAHARRLWRGPEALREELGEAEFDALREAGARMSLDEVDGVLEEAVRGARTSGPATSGSREP
jgi:predicted ATPase/class 3 adenylate cyclase